MPTKLYNWPDWFYQYARTMTHKRILFMPCCWSTIFYTFYAQFQLKHLFGLSSLKMSTTKKFQLKNCVAVIRWSTTNGDRPSFSNAVSLNWRSSLISIPWKFDKQHRTEYTKETIIMNTISKESISWDKFVYARKKLCTYKHIIVPDGVTSEWWETDPWANVAWNFKCLIFAFPKNTFNTHPQARLLHVHRLQVQRLEIVNNRFGNVLIVVLYILISFTIENIVI